MPIVHNNPVVKPATPEITLGKLWLRGFSVVAPEVGGAARVRATLVPYADDGTSDVTQTLGLGIANAFTLGDDRPDIDAAIETVLTSFGVPMQSGVSATLLLVEMIAQSVGAAAQVPDPEPDPVPDTNDGN